MKKVNIVRQITEFPIFSDHIKFIDIGANLTDPVFRGIYRSEQKHPDDFKLMLDRSKSCGIDKMIITAGNYEEAVIALDLCRKYDDLYCTIGVHPTRASEVPVDQIDDYFSKITNLAKEGIKEGKIVAYGEFGLDYDRLHFSDRLTQIHIFRKQLEVAQSLQLPLFLHCRNTGQEFIKNIYTPLQGCVHSFTDSLDEALELINMGLYIGFNGCSMKTEDNLNVIRSIPVNSIMIETDCPYCEIRSTHAGFNYVKTQFPQKKSDKYIEGTMVKGRNEPCGIRPVFEVICALKGGNPQEIGDIIYNNTLKVNLITISHTFHIAKRTTEKILHSIYDTL
ncbi:hypothetical protein WA158_000993 [Blastocystis sp. Blastoise]